MSDTIFDFGTSYDTVVAPAGDAATMAAIDQSALDVTAADTTATDTASAASDAGNLADAGTPLDVANADTATPAQPGDQTDTGVDPSERPPSQNTIAGLGPDQLPTGSASGASFDQAGGVTDLSTPASSKGIIDSVAQATKDNPAAANIIGKMLAGGATGAMTALALRNKMQAEREMENQRREDVIRKGQVPLLAPGTFTPKPGIINSRGA